MPRRRTVLLVVAPAALALGRRRRPAAWVAIAPTTGRRPAGRPPTGLRPRLRRGLAATGTPQGRPTALLVGDVEEPTALVFRTRDRRRATGSRTGEVRRVASGEIEQRRCSTSATTPSTRATAACWASPRPRRPLALRLPHDGDQDEEVDGLPLGADGVPEPDGERLVLAVDHRPPSSTTAAAWASGPTASSTSVSGTAAGWATPRDRQDPRPCSASSSASSPRPRATSPRRARGQPVRRSRRLAAGDLGPGVRNPFRRASTRDRRPVAGRRRPVLLGGAERLPPASAGEPRLGRPGGHPSLRGVGKHRRRDARAGAHLRPPGGLVRHRRRPSRRRRRGAPHRLLQGRLMVLEPGSGSEAPLVHDLGIRLERPVAVVAGPGEPWVLSLEGGVFRITG